MSAGCAKLERKFMTIKEALKAYLEGKAVLTAIETDGKITLYTLVATGAK